MSLRHRKSVNVADDPAAAGKLRPSDWGSPYTDYDTAPTHVFDGGALGALAMRDTGSVDGFSWVPSLAGVLVSDGDDEVPAFRALIASDIPPLAYAPADLTGVVVDSDIVSLAWSKLTDTPTSLAGYGIADPIVLTSGNYADPAWITSLDGAKVSGAVALATAASTATLATAATALATPRTINGVAFDGSGNITIGAAAADMTGTLGVTHGGTGTATQFTAGSVLFAGVSGVYAQDNANLFWDDANNRLGIGTAVPEALLQVGTMRVWQGGLGTSDATGRDSTFIGRNAGNANNAPSANNGIYNTFVGSSAGPVNTSGYAQTFVGYGAGFSNTTGTTNTNVGYQAGFFNVIGNNNTNLGVDAGAANTANDNIFIGFHAGGSFVTPITGALNVVIGNETVVAGTSLHDNAMLGYRAGRNVTSGFNNVLIGSLSGFALTQGDANVLIGKEAGTTLTTGTNNVFIGYRAGFSAQTSNFHNTGVGNLSLFGVTTGSQNTGFGSGSGQSITTGTFNTFVGYDAGNNASQLISATNSTAIGRGAFTTKSNQVVLGNASVTETLLRGNVGVGVTAFGTSAATVLGIGNGTEPSTSPADMVQLYSVDLSAGNATLGLRTETAVVTESVVSDRTLSIRINGTTYKLCLKS